MKTQKTKSKLSKLDVKKLRGIKGGQDYVSAGAGCNPTWSVQCNSAAGNCPPAPAPKPKLPPGPK